MAGPSHYCATRRAMTKIVLWQSGLRSHFQINPSEPCSSSRYRAARPVGQAWLRTANDLLTLVFALRPVYPFLPSSPLSQCFPSCYLAPYTPFKSKHAESRWMSNAQSRVGGFDHPLDRGELSRLLCFSLSVRYHTLIYHLISSPSCYPCALVSVSSRVCGKVNRGQVKIQLLPDRPPPPRPLCRPTLATLT